MYTHAYIGAWTEVSAGDGQLKAKYGVLPRRVVGALRLEDGHVSADARSAQVHMCIYVCVYVCMYVCVCIYICAWNMAT